MKAIFGNHPYSFLVPDEKSIAALTRDDLKGFVASYYVPNNAHIVVVGDIDPDETFAEIEKAFGSWKGGEAAKTETLTVPTRDKRQVYFVNRPGSIQSSIYIGNVTIPRKDKDYFRSTADTIWGRSLTPDAEIFARKSYKYSPV